LKIQKVLLGLILIVVAASANDATENKIISFLSKSIKKNIVVEHINIKKKVDLSTNEHNKWHGYIVGLKFQGKKEIKDVFFSDGMYITQSLVRLNDGNDMRNVIMNASISDLPAKMYSKEALIYGNGKNKNSMMIISDPLCPFCIPYINKVLNFIKDKKNVDIYYYSFPLKRIHPMSEYLSTYLLGLKLKGVKDVYKKYYEYAEKNKIENQRLSRSDIDKIIASIFSKADIKSVDYSLANKMLNKYSNTIVKSGIKETPFLFFNHKIDITRSKIFNLVETK